MRREDSGNVAANFRRRPLDELVARELREDERGIGMDATDFDGIRDDGRLDPRVNIEEIALERERAKGNKPRGSFPNFPIEIIRNKFK
jgi:hypothetical protein